MNTTANPGLQSPAKYIQESQLLLAYAAQNGLEIDNQVVSNLVEAKTALEQNRWDIKTEIQFWMAFNIMAKLVAPVSVDSLKATHVMAELGVEVHHNFLRRFWLWLLGGREISAAQQTVNTYQKGTLLVLGLLIVTQFYWLIGSNLVADITKTLPTRIEQLTQKKQQLLQNIVPEKRADDYDIFMLQTQIDESVYQLSANYQMLRAWNRVWQKLGFSVSMVEITDSDNSLERATQQDTIHLQEARFGLQALQLYLLPLLYGLLGATAYVLRALTTEIRSLTYEIESNIRYRLRIQLGALSGLAVGWFTDAQTASSLAFSSFSLSPLALAFLAGYSVELLFAIMDRLISAFSTSDINQPAKPLEKGVLQTNKTPS